MGPGFATNRSLPGFRAVEGILPTLNFLLCNCFFKLLTGIPKLFDYGLYAPY
jgi:hypothetical protein